MIIKVDAQSNPNYSIDDFIDESEWIVEGEIINKNGYYGKHGLIFTEYQMEVWTVYKGTTEKKVISFSALGGVVGDEALAVCPAFEVAKGARGIVGLRTFSNTQKKIAVSANFSWLQKDENQNSYIDFKGHAYSTKEWIDKMENETGRSAQVIKRTRGESLPEVMVTISSISPLTTQAGRGQEVTITGSGFGSSRGSGAVVFQWANVDFAALIQPAYQYITWSNTQIRCIVPSNAATGRVKVVTNSGAESSPSSQTLAVTYNIANVGSLYPGYLIDDQRFDNGGYAFKYSTNTANGGVSFLAVPQAVAAFERATTTWNNGTSFSIFTEPICGTTSIQRPDRDGENVIMFDNNTFDLDTFQGGSAIGLCLWRFAKCGISEWEVQEIDLVLRRNGDPNGFGHRINWHYGPGTTVPSGHVDFESVVLHELGHGHQLGHCLQPGCVMYPYINQGVTKRNLTSSETGGGNYERSISLAYNPPIQGCSGFNYSRRYENYNANNRCSAFLPLELIRFESNVKGKDAITLDWLTASEVNHKKIILETKMEGHQEWLELAVFDHNPQSATHFRSYNYVHKGLSDGTYFYRLKIISTFNEVEYSNIVSESIDRNGRLVKVRSLPGRLEVEVAGKFPNHLDYQLISSSGQVIKSGALVVGSGSKRNEISTTEIPDGVYFMTFIDEGTRWRETKKFFIE